jgi:hypothetical protein
MSNHQTTMTLLKFILYSVHFVAVLFLLICRLTTGFVSREAVGKHSREHAGTPVQISAGICNGMTMSLFRPVARNGI